MGHEELKEIGINAYGHRHKLIKGVERLLGGQQGKLFEKYIFYIYILYISYVKGILIWIYVNDI